MEVAMAILLTLLLNFQPENAVAATILFRLATFWVTFLLGLVLWTITGKSLGYQPPRKAASLRVDFHCHTIHSSDSLTRIPAIIQAARRIGLDKLVITDHNTIDGALEAFQLAPDLVIVGEEVKTTEGEFLAAFVTEPLPKKLEPFEALSRLKDQGAFISISHPFDPVRSGWSRETLERLAPHLVCTGSLERTHVQS